MRVLHVIGKLGSGGIENFVINVYRHIDRMQMQFDFVVFRDIKEFYEEEVKRLGGKKIVLDTMLNKNFFNRIKRIFNFFIYLKQHPEYKIVHIHMSSPSTFVVYVLVAKVLNRKTITHSHASGDYRQGIIRKCLYALCRKILWKISDVPLACSEEAAIWMFSGKYNKKVRIIHNGIDIEQFAYCESIRHRMRLKYNLENHYVIGHIGRFAPEKNQKFLLEIVQKIKEFIPVKLLLVGNGSEIECIKKLVCQKRLEHEVTFIGESHAVADLLQAIDIFLLPSLYEGLGIVALEAQAAGLPCILSNGVPKVVKCIELCTFLSLDDGAKKWSDKVMEFSENKNRQLDIAERKRIMKFDIQNITNDIEDIYNEVFAIKQ